MRGRDQANVDGAIADVAQSPEIMFFENLQQLGLHLQVDVANLIQKNGAVIGDLQKPLFGGDGAGERSLFVTEQLGFQEFARQSGAVQVEEGLVRASGRCGGSSSRARPYRSRCRPAMRIGLSLASTRLAISRRR